MEEQAERKVLYADREELEIAILSKYLQVAMPVNFAEEINEAESSKKSPRTKKKSCR